MLGFLAQGFLRKRGPPEIRPTEIRLEILAKGFLAKQKGRGKHGAVRDLPTVRRFWVRG